MRTSHRPARPIKAEARPPHLPPYLLRLKKLLERYRLTQAGPVGGPLRNTVQLTLLLAVAYFALGRFSFFVAEASVGLQTHIFYPAGLALAFTIIFGQRVAPGVLLGHLALTVAEGAYSPGMALLSATLATGIASLGSLLFWRLRISPRFRRPRDVALFVALSALVLQPLGAAGCELIQFLLERPSPHGFTSTWLSWWLANMLGQVLLVPFLLTCLSEPFVHPDRKELKQALFISSLYLFPLLIFTLSDSRDVSAIPFILLQATFYLPLIGLAVRAQLRTVSLSALFITEPFIHFVHAGLDVSSSMPDYAPYLLSSLVVFTGVCTAQFISALRTQATEANSQLEQAINAHERLLAIIGHDLRGPLAMVTNFMDLMIEGELDESEFREVQTDLRKGLDQANGILANLMDWAETETSQSPATVSDFYLRTSAQEVINTLFFSANSKEIIIRNHISPNAVVSGNEQQVRAVIRNLLSNAIKFSHRRSEVTLDAEKFGEAWEVEVEDSGVGMTEEQLAGLFDRTTEFTAIRGTENEKGVGLGLQICRKFVEAHHGKISVTSEEGQGTRIRFTLPAGDSPGEQSLQAVSEGKPLKPKGRSVAP